MERRLQIRAVLEDIREACDFVVEAAEGAGLDARAVYHCEMAVDEICTNVVEHGYTAKDGQGSITIITRQDNDCLHITITDNGVAFDPTVRDDPDLKTDVYKMEPGGWGIYFVKQLMNAVSYEYRDGLNHLHLKKCIAGAAETTVSQHDLSIQVKAAEKGYWSVLLTGRLDSSSSSLLSDTIKDQFSQDHTHLVIDMKGVEYVSSSGLKVLAAAWRDARDKKGSIMLAGLNQRLHEVFDMVGFTTFFDIFPDVDHALQSVG